MRIIDERDSALLFFSHSKLQWNKVNPTSQVTARKNVGSSVLSEKDATVSQTFPKFNTVDPTFCKLMLKIKKLSMEITVIGFLRISKYINNV